MSSSLLRLVACAVLIGPVAAQETGPSLRPGDGAFKEYLADTALSSGATFHGAQIARTDRGARRPLETAPLVLYVPAEWRGDDALCLTTSSADGLYSGQVPYSLKEAAPQALIPAIYPTREQDYLAALPPGQLAVAVTRGGCGSYGFGAGAPEQPFEIAPAAWRSGWGDSLRLHVNSFGAGRVVVDFDRFAHGASIDCAPLDAPTRAAYDTECALDLGALQSLEGAAEGIDIAIRPYTRGIEGEATWIRLFVPPAG